jgi:hypothetical protein
MARFLTLSDENKDKVDIVIAYAMSHPYILDAPNAVSPGDIPGHCCFLDTYHCVFSFTVSHGQNYRHLSISIPITGRFPNMIAATIIAGWFGFSKPEEGIEARSKSGAWIVGPNPKENCIVIAEKI